MRFGDISNNQGRQRPPQANSSNPYGSSQLENDPNASRSIVNSESPSGKRHHFPRRRTGSGNNSFPEHSLDFSEFQPVTGVRSRGLSSGDAFVTFASAMPFTFLPASARPMSVEEVTMYSTMASNGYPSSMMPSSGSYSGEYSDPHSNGSSSGPEIIAEAQRADKEKLGGNSNLVQVREHSSGFPSIYYPPAFLGAAVPPVGVNSVGYIYPSPELFAPVPEQDIPTSPSGRARVRSGSGNNTSFDGNFRPRAGSGTHAIRELANRHRMRGASLFFDDLPEGAQMITGYNALSDITEKQEKSGVERSALSSTIRSTDGVIDFHSEKSPSSRGSIPQTPSKYVSEATVMIESDSLTTPKSRSRGSSTHVMNLPFSTMSPVHYSMDQGRSGAFGMYPGMYELMSSQHPHGEFPPGTPFNPLRYAAAVIDSPVSRIPNAESVVNSPSQPNGKGGAARNRSSGRSVQENLGSNGVFVGHTDAGSHTAAHISGSGGSSSVNLGPTAVTSESVRELSSQARPPVSRVLFSDADIGSGSHSGSRAMGTSNSLNVSLDTSMDSSIIGGENGGEDYYSQGQRHSGSESFSRQESDKTGSIAPNANRNTGSNPKSKLKRENVQNLEPENGVPKGSDTAPSTPASKGSSNMPGSGSSSNGANNRRRQNGRDGIYTYNGVSYSAQQIDALSPSSAFALTQSPSALRFSRPNISPLKQPSFGSSVTEESAELSSVSPQQESLRHLPNINTVQNSNSFRPPASAEQHYSEVGSYDEYSQNHPVHLLNQMNQMNMNPVTMQQLQMMGLGMMPPQFVFPNMPMNHMGMNMNMPMPMNMNMNMKMNYMSGGMNNTRNGFQSSSTFDPGSADPRYSYIPPSQAGIVRGDVPVAHQGHFNAPSFMPSMPFVPRSSGAAQDSEHQTIPPSSASTRARRGQNPAASSSTTGQTASSSSGGGAAVGTIPRRPPRHPTASSDLTQHMSAFAKGLSRGMGLAASAAQSVSGRSSRTASVEPSEPRDSALHTTSSSSGSQVSKSMVPTAAVALVPNPSSTNSSGRETRRGVRAESVEDEGHVKSSISQSRQWSEGPRAPSPSASVASGHTKSTLPLSATSTGAAAPGKRPKANLSSSSSSEGSQTLFRLVVDASGATNLVACGPLQPSFQNMQDIIVRSACRVASQLIVSSDVKSSSHGEERFLRLLACTEDAHEVIYGSLSLLSLAPLSLVGTHAEQVPVSIEHLKPDPYFSLLASHTTLPQLPDLPELSLAELDTLARSFLESNSSSPSSSWVETVTQLANQELQRRQEDFTRQLTERLSATACPLHALAAALRSPAARASPTLWLELIKYLEEVSLDSFSNFEFELEKSSSVVNVDVTKGAKKAPLYSHFFTSEILPACAAAVRTCATWRRFGPGKDDSWRLACKILRTCARARRPDALRLFFAAIMDATAPPIQSDSGSSLVLLCRSLAAIVRGEGVDEPAVGDKPNLQAFDPSTGVLWKVVLEFSQCELSCGDRGGLIGRVLRRCCPGLMVLLDGSLAVDGSDEHEEEDEEDDNEDFSSLAATEGKEMSSVISPEDIRKCESASERKLSFRRLCAAFVSNNTRLALANGSIAVDLMNLVAEFTSWRATSRAFLPLLQALPRYYPLRYAYIRAREAAQLISLTRKLKKIEYPYRLLPAAYEAVMLCLFSGPGQNRDASLNATPRGDKNRRMRAVSSASLTITPNQGASSIADTPVQAVELGVIPGLAEVQRSPRLPQPLPLRHSIHSRSPLVDRLAEKSASSEEEDREGILFEEDNGNRLLPHERTCGCARRRLLSISMPPAFPMDNTSAFCSGLRANVELEHCCKGEDATAALGPTPCHHCRSCPHSSHDHYSTTTPNSSSNPYSGSNDGGSDFHTPHGQCDLPPAGGYSAADILLHLQSLDRAIAGLRGVSPQFFDALPRPEVLFSHVRTLLSGVSRESHARARSETLLIIVRAYLLTCCCVVLVFRIRTAVVVFHSSRALLARSYFALTHPSSPPSVMNASESPFFAQHDVQSLLSEADAVLRKLYVRQRALRARFFAAARALAPQSNAWDTDLPPVHPFLGLEALFPASQDTPSDIQGETSNGSVAGPSNPRVIPFIYQQSLFLSLGEDSMASVCFEYFILTALLVDPLAVSSLSLSPRFLRACVLEVGRKCSPSRARARDCTVYSIPELTLSAESTTLKGSNTHEKEKSTTPGEEEVAENGEWRRLLELDSLEQQLDHCKSTFTSRPGSQLDSKTPESECSCNVLFQLELDQPHSLPAIAAALVVPPPLDFAEPYRDILRHSCDPQLSKLGGLSEAPAASIMVRLFLEQVLQAFHVLQPLASADLAALDPSVPLGLGIFANTSGSGAKSLSQDAGARGGFLLQVVTPRLFAEKLLWQLLAPHRTLLLFCAVPLCAHVRMAALRNSRFVNSLPRLLYSEADNLEMVNSFNRNVSSGLLGVVETSTSTAVSTNTLQQKRLPPVQAFQAHITLLGETALLLQLQGHTDKAIERLVAALRLMYPTLPLQVLLAQTDTDALRAARVHEVIHERGAYFQRSSARDVEDDPKDLLVPLALLLEQAPARLGLAQNAPLAVPLTLSLWLLARAKAASVAAGTKPSNLEWPLWASLAANLLRSSHVKAAMRTYLCAVCISGFSAGRVWGLLLRCLTLGGAGDAVSVFAAILFGNYSEIQGLGGGSSPGGNKKGSSHSLRSMEEAENSPEVPSSSLEKSRGTFPPALEKLLRTLEPAPLPRRSSFFSPRALSVLLEAEDLCDTAPAIIAVETEPENQYLQSLAGNSSSSTNSSTNSNNNNNSPMPNESPLSPALTSAVHAFHTQLLTIRSRLWKIVAPEHPPLESCPPLPLEPEDFQDTDLLPFCPLLALHGRGITTKQDLLRLLLPVPADITPSASGSAQGQHKSVEMMMGMGIGLPAAPRTLTALIRAGRCARAHLLSARAGCIALHHVRRGGEVWTEATRLLLNPLSPYFHPHMARSCAVRASHFTGQYGDVFILRAYARSSEIIFEEISRMSQDALAAADISTEPTLTATASRSSSKRINNSLLGLAELKFMTGGYENVNEISKNSALDSRSYEKNHIPLHFRFSDDICAAFSTLDTVEVRARVHARMRESLVQKSYSPIFDSILFLPPNYGSSWSFVSSLVSLSLSLGVSGGSGISSSLSQPLASGSQLLESCLLDTLNEVLISRVVSVPSRSTQHESSLSASKSPEKQAEVQYRLEPSRTADTLFRQLFSVITHARALFARATLPPLVPAHSLRHLGDIPGALSALGLGGARLSPSQWLAEFCALVSQATRIPGEKFRRLQTSVGTVVPFRLGLAVFGASASARVCGGSFLPLGGAHAVARARALNGLANGDPFSILHKVEADIAAALLQGLVKRAEASMSLPSLSVTCSAEGQRDDVDTLTGEPLLLRLAPLPVDPVQWAIKNIGWFSSNPPIDPSLLNQLLLLEEAGPLISALSFDVLQSAIAGC